MRVKSYDFRKPDRPLGSLEQRLENWLRAACQLGEKHWPNYLPFGVETEVQGIERGNPEEAMAQLPEASVGYRVSLNAEEALSLLVWPRQLALALVAGALGETVDVLPDDREKTAVEQSLCEFLIQNVLLSALHETWPGSSPLQLAVRDREPIPKFSRVFLHAEYLFVCSMTLSGPFGVQPMLWLLPPVGVWATLMKSAAASKNAAPATDVIEQHVRSLPVEVSVELGSIDLHLAEVARLAAGDVLILNQRVTEPLTTRVDGRRKFLGWPGRVGSRQGLKIASSIG